MDPLKEMFNDTYFKKLVKNVSEVYLRVDKKKMYQDLIVGLPARSLNQRMRHTSMVLKKYLPDDYKSALQILDDLIPKMDKGYTTLVFPDYVSLYGLDHLTLSMQALKNYTQYGSSEFAVRSFLKKDFEQTLHIMKAWSLDRDYHVRRLSSEGSRPRLPWSFKLDEIIKDPSLTTPILNNLKSDKELYVRKSVANHLNDISKENPEYMLSLVESWDQSHEHTAWIIKHASRTLVKKGNSAALSMFGVKSEACINVEDFQITPSRIKLGGTIQFKCKIRSISNNPQKILIDYIVHYVKKGGSHAPKVFKLKEFTLNKGEVVEILKNQKIVDFSTRVHYKGIHKIDVQVNGKIYSGGEFVLE
ncbi:MAG: DNA alkylation repair protein [Saprospiraceae bacterium]|nr:DNA alkylation repair protein [Saprospiraceae bacterium]